MKLKSILFLLKIGEFITQRQERFKRIFNCDDMFTTEIALINEIIFINCNIVRVKKETSYIADTDYYEFLFERINLYYHGKMQLDEIINDIRSTRFDATYYVGVDEMLKQEQSTQITNKLFELKYLLEFKRHKFGHLLGDMEKTITNEKRILQMALEELGDKRYIKKSTVS